MGNMEDRVRKRARKQDIRYALLASVKVAGMLTLAMAAPNTLKLLKYVPGMKARYTSRILDSLKRLQERGFVMIKTRDGSRDILITKKGEALLARLTLQDVRLKRPKKWDGRWRIVIYDIPDKRKTSRDRLRMMLAAAGFVYLQNSVWVYPYDCEDIVTLLKVDAVLQKEVLYIVAEEVEGARELRKKFDLPNA